MSIQEQFELKLSTIPSRRGRKKKYVFELEIIGHKSSTKAKSIIEVLGVLYDKQVEAHKRDKQTIVLRSKRTIQPGDYWKQVQCSIIKEISPIINNVIEFVDTHNRRPIDCEIDWLAKKLPAGNELNRVPKHVALRSGEAANPIKSVTLRNRRTQRRTRQQDRDNSMRLIQQRRNDQLIDPSPSAFPA